MASVVEFLRKSGVAEAERYMGQSLTDIFHMMFNLDIVKTKDSDANAHLVPAHIMLTRGKTTAYVVLHVSSEAAVLIGQKVGMDVSSGLNEAQVEDVACEIANIVGNNLRTFLMEKLGIYFELGPALPGEVKTSSTEDSIVKLNFQVSSHASISLDFVASP